MSESELSLPFLDDPWGPHRSFVSDALSKCVDNVGRLRQTLDGGAKSSRHHFSYEAHRLYEAARDLVRLTDDIEHELIVCGQPVLYGVTDGCQERRCCLPLNHYGGHDDRPPRSLAVQVRDSAHDLMDDAEDTALWVNLLGLVSDNRRVLEIEKEFDPEDHEVFDELLSRARSISHLADKATGLIEALIYEVPQEEWDEMDLYVDEDDTDEATEAPVVELHPDVPLLPVRRARGLDL